MKWFTSLVAALDWCLRSLGGVYDQRYAQEWVYYVAIAQGGVSLDIGGIFVPLGQSYCLEYVVENWL